MEHKAIVFFDGVCGLCNYFVDKLLKADKYDRLRFAMLQGNTAREMLPQEKYENLDSVAVILDGKVYVKSKAILRALYHCRRGFRLLKIFEILPRPVLDKLYDFVATNRYQWFGKKEACRIPSPEERAKFLP